MLTPHGGNIVFKCNINRTDIDKLKVPSIFLQQILEAWSKTAYNENIDTISKQIIWNNSHIHCNNQMFFFKEWHNRGIQFVEHIYDYRNKRFYSLKNSKNYMILTQSMF